MSCGRFTKVHHSLSQRRYRPLVSPRRGATPFVGSKINEAPDDRGKGGRKRRGENEVWQCCQKRISRLHYRGAKRAKRRRAKDARQARSKKPRANDIREEPIPRSPRFARENAQKRNASMLIRLQRNIDQGPVSISEIITSARACKRYNVIAYQKSLLRSETCKFNESRKNKLVKRMYLEGGCGEERRRRRRGREAE